MGGLYARLVAIALIAGCYDATFTHCPTVNCPSTMVCDGLGGCATREQMEKCAGQPDGTSCSYTTVNQARVDGACESEVCRNREIPACLADLFADSRVDSGMWELWLADNEPIVVFEEPGRLAIELASNVGRLYNGVQSRGRYDMIAGHAAVKVTPASQHVGVETSFSVDLDATLGFTMSAYANRLHMVVHTSGGVTNSFATEYDPIAHAFWRIRHDALNAAVEMETSSDGVTWFSQRSSAVSRLPTGVTVTLLAGIYIDLGVVDPGIAYFERLKLTSASCP